MNVCPHCSFHNEPSAEKCHKCEQPMPEKGSADPWMFSIPEENGIQSFFSPESWTASSNNDLSLDLMKDEGKTVDEVFSCPNCWQTPLAAPPGPANPCPNCGYKSAAKPPESSSEPTPPPVSRHTVVMQELEIEPEEPEFHLVNERKDQDLRFKGSTVVLRRDNVDAENRSLSSRSHARISKENGRWYLEDQSSNQATFLQVKGKIPLEAGDRIILGNKIFRFEAE